VTFELKGDLPEWFFIIKGAFMTNRRSAMKIETKESKALKRMRETTGMSVVEAAKASGFNATKIGHMEQGRATITPEYIQAFLKAFNFNQKDWEMFINGEQTVYEKKLECVELVEKLSLDKIELVWGLLKNLK